MHTHTHTWTHTYAHTHTSHHCAVMDCLFYYYLAPVRLCWMLHDIIEGPCQALLNVTRYHRRTLCTWMVSLSILWIWLKACVCCRIHSIVLMIVSVLFGLFVMAIGCDQVRAVTVLLFSLVLIFNYFLFCLQKRSKHTVYGVQYIKSSSTQKNCGRHFFFLQFFRRSQKCF